MKVAIPSLSVIASMLTSRPLSDVPDKTKTRSLRLTIPGVVFLTLRVPVFSSFTKATEVETGLVSSIVTYCGVESRI